MPRTLFPLLKDFPSTKGFRVQAEYIFNSLQFHLNLHFLFAWGLRSETLGLFEVFPEHLQISGHVNSPIMHMCGLCISWE